MSHRVVAIIADPIGGSEAVEQLRSAAGGEEVDLRLIAAPVEANPLRHTLGDIDEPKREASERLQASLDNLRDAGLEARGAVGDPDPIQAAQDALLEAPADEVVIFEREASESRWFEGDLTERAEGRTALQAAGRLLRSAPRSLSPWSTWLTSLGCC